jgi:hypothetical protein
MEFIFVALLRFNMDEIVKDYETLVKEIDAKVAEAVSILEEAKALAVKANVSLWDTYRWSDLRYIAEEFIDFDSIYTDRGWDTSGCSF